VVNVAVPVRVFDGGKFIDSLRLEDFEVTEDGKLQPVQAVYFIQKNDVKRREAPPRTAAPVATRHFVLLFQMTEYLPEVNAAIDYFFDNVFLRGDTLDVVTIRTTYRLREDVSSKALREKTKNEIKAKLRQDIVILGGEVRSIVREMIGNLEEGMDLDAYEVNLQRLESMRSLDEKRMIAFGEGLRKLPGAKHVFLFFQREMIPQLSPKVLTGLLSNVDYDLQFKLMSLMTHFYRDIQIDKTAIERAFSDASVDIHFLYVTKAGQDVSLDVSNPRALNVTKMEEHSEDIYKAFYEIAAATGGIADTSHNMVNLMKTAAEASERYYLLYYRPRDYRDDGKFHEIRVRIKNRDYSVSHRAGYFAKDMPVDPLISPDVKKPAPIPETKTIKIIDEAQAAELSGLLRKAAGYCRKLESAALNFVCLEEVQERIYGPTGDIRIGGPSEAPVNMPGNALGRQRSWTYDYQLIQSGGHTQEKRTLLAENGEKRREEGAELRTTRFIHRNIFLGPIGLLSEAAQAKHSYRYVKEGKIDGEAAVIVEVIPADRTGASMFGKAWIRKRDGAVVRIEWEPTSMGNYEKIAQFSRQFDLRPKLAFASEYGFEKNGLRFPSSYEVTEAYLGLATRWGNVLSRTSVTYKGYKFFLVETVVEIKIP
jgi:VWFA-related protein